MEMFTSSFPIRTVARNVLGAFRRCNIYLNPESFLIFLRRNLILLSEKKAVSDEEKKPERSSRIIITTSLIE
jgi:hypothetical protein